MGLGIVLLFWAIAGCIMAGIGAFVLGGGVAHLSRSATSDRRRLIITAAAFPFVCLAWGGAVFVFQAVVNEGPLHRDLGIGDTWHAPLPNGYQVMFIDVTDNGVVYNPKSQRSPGGVGEQEDAVFGVQQVQLAGRYILGARSTCITCTDAGGIDNWFILDTQTNKRTSLNSADALKSAASALGIDLRLEPLYSLYSRYRFTWFDVVAGILFIAPPIAGFIVLVLWLRRVRRTRLTAANSS